MKAGGIKCDGRRYHLEQWLNRGAQIRASLAPHRSRMIDHEPNTNSLSRCRSLEVLQSDAINNNMMHTRTSDLRRSADVLDSEVIVHRGADDQDNTTRTNSQQSCNPGMSSHYNGSLEDRCEELSKSRFSEDRTTSSSHRKEIVLSVSERLEGLLSKTNEIIQMKGLVRRRNGDGIGRAQKWLNDNKALRVSSSSQYGKAHTNKFPHLKKLYENEDNSTQMINYEMNQITSSLLKSIGGNNDRLLFGKPDGDAHAHTSRHHPNSEQRTAAPEFHRHKLDGGGFNDPNQEQLDLNVEYYNNSNGAAQIEASDIGHEYPDGHNGQFEYNSSNNGMMTAGGGLFQNTGFEDIRSSDSNIGDSVDKMKTYDSLANASADEVDNGNNFPEMTNTRALRELKSRMLNGAHWRSQVLRESLMTVNKHNDNQSSYETATHSGYEQKVEHNDAHPSSRGTISGTEMRLSTISSHQHKPTESTNQSRLQKHEMNGARYNGGSAHDSDGSESSDEEYDTDFGSNSQNRHQSNAATTHAADTSHLKQVRLMTHPDSTRFDYNKLQMPDASTSRIDTSFLVPKDAYFHDLSKMNRPPSTTNPSTEKAMPQVIGRNRNPLPYSIACAGDILSDRHLASDLSTYYQNGLSYANDPTTLDHQLSHNKFLPNEKLLSQRKFESAHRVLSPMQEITIMNGANSQDDLSPMDHEYKNDSGYTNNSHESSPSLLKPADSEKNGSFNQTYIPDSNETNRLATATGIPLTRNCVRKNGGNFVPANFSASSLV